MAEIMFLEGFNGCYFPQYFAVRSNNYPYHAAKLKSKELNFKCKIKEHFVKEIFVVRFVDHI